MIKLIKSPAQVHPVYSPAVFTFESDTENLLTIKIQQMDDKKELSSFDVNVPFFGGKAVIDVAPYLKMFLNNKLNELTSVSVADRALYCNYTITYLYKTTEVFTGLHYASQVRCSQDLTSFTNALLTGFNKLIVYDGYPADVATLASKDATWKQKPIVGGAVNRLALDCGDKGNLISVGVPFIFTGEWSDFICQMKASGGDFIPISTPQNLINIKTIPNPDNLPYALTSDLDFNGYTDWTPITAFSGQLYGQGKTISNLTITNKSSLFDSVSGLIQDIKFDNVNIHNSEYSTAIILSTTATSSIVNCHVTNATVISARTMASRVSVLIASATGKVKYCSVTNSTITAGSSSNKIGLICGSLASNSYGDGKMEDCFASGDITNPAGWWTGILCGTIALRDTSISRCIAKGNLTVSYLGGIISDEYAPGELLIQNSVAVGGSITASNVNQIGRITSGTQVLNCYSVNMSVGRTITSSANGKDGDTITEAQAKSQLFYEGLGYDFMGATQDDSNPVWGMGADGYPAIVKPFKQLSAEECTGHTTATTLQLTKAMLDKVEPSYPKTYNILNKFDATPGGVSFEELTYDEYSQLSESDLSVRRVAFLTYIQEKEKAESYINIINNITKVSVDCYGEEDEMIGDIKEWPGAVIPKNWMICNGGSLPVADYPGLYSIIGNTFGGNAIDFNLPNMCGRVTLGVGTSDAAGGSTYALNDRNGEEKHQLLPDEQGTFTISTRGDDGDGDANSRQSVEKIRINGAEVSTPREGWGEDYKVKLSTALNAHENRQPYIAIYKIIRVK